MNVEETSKLAVFEGKRIRKTLHEGEWWFSIIDVIEALVGATDHAEYSSEGWTPLMADEHQAQDAECVRIIKQFG